MPGRFVDPDRIYKPGTDRRNVGSSWGRTVAADLEWFLANRPTVALTGTPDQDQVFGQGSAAKLVWNTCDSDNDGIWNSDGIHLDIQSEGVYLATATIYFFPWDTNTVRSYGEIVLDTGGLQTKVIARAEHMVVAANSSYHMVGTFTANVGDRVFVQGFHDGGGDEEIEAKQFGIIWLAPRPVRSAG
jgi:hypothetical protein